MQPNRKESISDKSTSSGPESSTGSSLLRPLLPAARPPPARDQHYQPAPLARKRVPTSLACEPCRQRKIKCNGGRPTCTQCRAKRLDCVYRASVEDSYRERYEALQESHPAAVVYRAIQTRPQAEALEIFRRIQAGVDPETLSRQLSSADLLLQVQLEPETRSRYQFIYSPLMPPYLQTPTNPFMQSLIHEWSEGDDISQIAAPAQSDPDMGYRAQYLRPYHAACIVDSRLDDIVPSKWTSVNASDSFMRRLIRAYFLQEYDWFTFFHKDYFLDDMVTGSTTFCSSILVNAVLAVGCQCQNHQSEPAEFWNPSSLGYKFLVEAKRLWILEVPKQRSLTTLQAALVMNTITNMYDMDPLSSAFLVRATSMAHELGLFEPSTYIMNRRLRQSYDITAWSLFHWQWCVIPFLNCLKNANLADNSSTLSYQFMTTPLLKTPPRNPLPDPDRDPDWYGEIWLKYPSSSVLVPLRYGITFKAKMELSIVLNEAMLEISDYKDGNDSAQDAAKRIVNMAKRLEAWYQALPEPLSPSKIVFPSQLKLHLHYCYVMVQLYEILASAGDKRPSSVPVDKRELHRSLSKYRGYFETILRIHYLRHSFEYGNMMLTRFLSMLACLALNKLESLTTGSNPALKASSLDVGDEDPESARATLLIAQKGLSDQGRGYYLPQTLLRDVLSHMSPSDANILQSFITIQPETPGKKQERKMNMESQCPPDILHIANDEAQQPDANWIRRFAMMTLGEHSGHSILGMIAGGKDA
ncbi:hypothetical protein F66182_1905 [Fusarium sp. NRRL 66182]|nr:hypothetical protein F66182_1905 [Fusarium sp. NRRL 66182]